LQYSINIYLNGNKWPRESIWDKSPHDMLECFNIILYLILKEEEKSLPTFFCQPAYSIPLRLALCVRVHTFPIQIQYEIMFHLKTSTI
jgi:hypothetical protein